MVGYGAGWWRWHRKVLAELIFGQALSPCFGDCGALLWCYLSLICIQRLGEPLGGSGVSGNGLGRTDGGWKVDDVLLLHFLGGPLVGYFPARERLFSRGSPLGLVEGVEESPVELVTWQKVTWVGWTEAPKLVTCCCFLLLG